MVFDKNAIKGAYNFAKFLEIAKEL